MIDKKMLEEYKKLSDYAKNKLYDFLVFKACYTYNPNMSDDLALRIFSLAHECWMEYGSVDIENYAEYILEAIYEFDGTIDELEEIGPRRIVDLYDEEFSAEELLVFDTDSLKYCFETTDNNKYYDSVEDKYIIVNQKGRKIGESNFMEDGIKIFFDLMSENKIKDISNTMHYNIRSEIKEEFGDEEYELYKNGISRYKEYCEKKHITSRTILDSTGLMGDIDLFDIDKEYSNTNKLSKLQTILKKNEIENYVYACSLDNGTDYYFDNVNETNYIAIDKNGVLKKIDNNSFFLLNELHNEEDNFIYISKSELKRIKYDLQKEHNNYNVLDKNIIENYKTLSLKKFWDYITKHDIDVFKDDIGLKCFIDNKIRRYKSVKVKNEFAKEPEKLKLSTYEKEV